MPEVRRATPEDAPFLVGSLASAFIDDPVSAFLFPNAARRESILGDVFALQLSRTYLPRGEVYTTADRTGASMWLPPNSAMTRLRDQLVYLRVSLIAGRWRSARRLTLLLQRLRPLTEHYYLGTIGIVPAQQRRGLGTALMRPVLARCDAAGVGAYLECSRDANTHFYGQLGFRVTNEIEAPGGGPRLWLMWREPNTYEA
ncbi:MAG TPA: GNAT family N-acetyltransferase [Acidimicrobiales bacterium]|nr:GNAT family N-acetyltransferase [Acidimicrobiales bacterium]